MTRERPASANNQTFNSFSNLPRPIQEPYISWKGKPHDTNSSRDINKTYNLNLPTNARPIIPGFDTNTTNNRGRANPIKHWRKQLVPTFGNYSRSAVTIRNAMDAPGANSKQTNNNKSDSETETETETDSGNNCLKPNNIKHFLINNMVNNCSKEDPNKKLCDPTTIRRPATTIINTHFDRTPGVNKRVSSKYHQTHASYLRSRVKLYNQNQTISQIKDNTYYVNPEAIENGQSEALIIKPPTDSSSGSQVFNSVYCIDNHCGNDVLKKNNKVIYKPNNTGFSNQGGVPSSLRTLNIQKNEVNKAAVSLKKDFGRSVTNNSRYRGLNREPITTKSFNQIIPGNSLCKNVQIINTQDSRRQPSGGTGNGLVCGD